MGDLIPRRADLCVHAASHISVAGVAQVWAQSHGHREELCLKSDGDCGAGLAHSAGTAQRCNGNSDLLPSPGCGNPGEDVPAMPLWAASSAARLNLPSRGRTPRGSGCSCPWMPERGLQTRGSNQPALLRL